jgi:acyl-CoA reductase-like NAD-dependent aldehyde dehydrogenase
VASASACDARGGAASCTAPGWVAGFVDRARGYGAEILAGGSTIGAKGFFYQPSLIGGVAQDSEIVQKEVFAPVVSEREEPLVHATRVVDGALVAF